MVLTPNPVKTELTITNGQGVATIYNLLAQPVRTFNINNQQTRIHLTDLVSGQYVLTIQKQNGQVVTKRFLISN